MELEKLSVEDLLNFLSFKNIPSDVLENFSKNGVDGTTFLLMEDEHFKEVAPKIVDRINLKKVQNNYKVSYRFRYCRG